MEIKMYNPKKNSIQGRATKNKSGFQWTNTRKALLATVIAVVAVASIVTLVVLYGRPPGAGIIAPDDEYTISVIDRYDSDELTSANISYWDSDIDGLPDDMLASGTPDNVSMINYDFSAIVDYWVKVELSGYKSVWEELDTDGENIIQLTKLPTADATGSILNSSGGAWANQTSDNGTIRFTWATAQNGTGFNTEYNADTNTTSYLELVFTFNDTASAGLVELSNEVEDDKAVSTVNLTVPIDVLFLVGDDTLTNYLELACEIDLAGTIALTEINLEYDGVNYATITI
jgi:hypothetical protein